MEHIKSQWADGNMQEWKDSIEGSAKCQLLMDMVDLDYDDIRNFFTEAGHMKERESDFDDEGRT